MANWGTFGGSRVHKLQPDGGWTLLVGENGSGKSTAIDALRTLLAPRTILRGSFNDAAGGQNRRDRSLTSYIRGQWSASREEEGTKAQFLRDEDITTNLLATFRNAATGAQLTIAQILWVSEGTDQTIYLVAQGQKSIVPDLQDLGNGREVRRRLEERGFAVYKSYPGYAGDFHQKMGIPGDGAMEVFNQAIGVKEVVSVKQFLRSHLLAPGQAMDTIRDRVIPQFASLEDCWNSILRDKERLRLLLPVVEAHTKEREAAENKARLDVLATLVPNYYGRRHWELLDDHIISGTHELQGLEASLFTLQGEIEDASETQNGCQRKLDGHGDTLLIQQLALRIERQELDMRDVRNNRQSFDTVVKAQNLGDEVTDERGFLAAKSAAGKRAAEIRDQETQATEQANKVGAERAETKQNLDETTVQYEDLLQRRVLIDLDLQRIRDWICEHEGLSKEGLPFAGELIEVKPEREDWHGAIERLMRGFGVSMLVPEARYQQVAGLINRTRMTDSRGRGLRIQFHRVPASNSEPPPQPERDTVAGCLNHRQDHPLSRWVQGEVVRQFNHRCCRDTVELESVRFGLTREGLIRGGTRHDKDDRSAVGDRTRWVLGWSPEKKLQALAEHIESLKLDLAKLRNEEDGLRRRSESLREDGRMLERLQALQSFQQIDLTGGLRKLDEMKKEKERLEQRSSDRIRLEEELKDAKAVVTALRIREKDLEQRRTRLTDQLEKEEGTKARIEAALPPNLDLPDEAGIAYLTEIEGGQSCTLETIKDLERKVADTLRRRASQQQGIINSVRTSMGAPMQQFLHAFPEDSKDLQAHPDYAEDYVRIHARVARDDLPKHEERFRTFLNDNLTQHIASLDAGLVDEVKGHRVRISQVNAALRDLEYAPDSYVEVDVRERGEQAVAVFRKQLREILGMGMQDDDGARMGLFQKIRELVEALKKPEWTKLVADSRNWLDFGVRECRRADGSEIDYFDSSQGKSGGQKAKLAFTILAASLCAQYGLADDQNALNGFRLVVIDEIFARTDEPNSRRALNLFRSMGFQLILAAPWEAKVRIAEPYVNNYHLAVNPEHHSSTIRRASREAYEKAVAART